MAYTFYTPSLGRRLPCCHLSIHDKTHASLPAQQLFSCRHNSIRLETKFSLQLLERCRGPESFHPNHAAGSADVSLPSESGCLLDSDPRFHVRWQHAVPILLRLKIEDV